MKRYLKYLVLLLAALALPFTAIMNGYYIGGKYLMRDEVALRQLNLRGQNVGQVRSLLGQPHDILKSEESETEDWVYYNSPKWKRGKPYAMYLFIENDIVISVIYAYK